SGRVQQRWILKHLAEARQVVCVSAKTAKDLGRLTDGAEQRVIVIPNALERSCKPASQGVVRRLRERLGIAADERYLFHIGGNLWYKNRPGVARIYEGVRRRLGAEGSKLRLVMAGAPLPPEMRAWIAGELPAGSVIEVIDPKDEELWALYTGATA